MYTRATLGHEPHNHRFFAARHEAEAERGAPMEDHQPWLRRRVVVVVPLRLLVRGGLVQVTEIEKYDFESGIKMENGILV